MDKKIYFFVGGIILLLTLIQIGYVEPNNKNEVQLIHKLNNSCVGLCLNSYGIDASPYLDYFDRGNYQCTCNGTITLFYIENGDVKK